MLQTSDVSIRESKIRLWTDRVELRIHNWVKCLEKSHRNGKKSFLTLCNLQLHIGFFDNKNWYIQNHSTVRPWEACFLGNEKTRADQNSCKFCYLIGWSQDDQKTVLLKVFMYYINSFSSNIFRPYSKMWTCKVCDVQLEAVYLEPLL